MSILLNIDSSSSNNNSTSGNFTINYNPLIHLKKDRQDPSEFECALVSASLWYSWYNVDSSNNQFKYYNGTTWKTLTLTSGQYSVQTLNSQIQQGMQDNSDYLAPSTFYINFYPNYSTSYVLLYLQNNYQVDFSIPNSLANLLGFSNIIYSTQNTYISGSSPGNLNNGINNFLIHCSIIQGCYSNSQSSDVLFNFIPSVSPGSNIFIEPVKPIYLPLSNNNVISQITMKITDNNNNIINFNGQPVSYILHVRKIQ